MAGHTLDGWLRAAPAVRTKRDSLTPRTRSTMRSDFPIGRTPHQSLTSVPEVAADTKVCGTCHMASCDGLFH